MGSSRVVINATTINIINEIPSLPPKAKYIKIFVGAALKIEGPIYSIKGAPRVHSYNPSGVINTDFSMEIGSNSTDQNPDFKSSLKKI